MSTQNAMTPSSDDQGLTGMTAHRYVTRRILDALPGSIDNAVSAMHVVAEVDLTPNVAAVHLRKLVSRGLIERIGSGNPGDPYRYFKPNGRAAEEEKPMEKLEGTHTERLEQVLPDSAENALPPSELAELVGLQADNASALLGALCKRGRASRLGSGRPGRPYRYYSANGSAPVAEPEKPKKQAKPKPAAVELSIGGGYEDLIADLQAKAAHYETVITHIKAAIASIERLRGFVEI